MVLAQIPKDAIDKAKDKDSGGKPRCKYCDGKSPIRWGKQNGNQRYRCKDCDHVFDDNGKPPRMRTPLEAIAAAFELYYGHASLPTTSRLLRKLFGVAVSYETIRLWIQKYIPLVEDFPSHLSPNLSGIWHADETLLRFRPSDPLTPEQRARKVRRKGEDWWFWDAIDEHTRYIVGCHLSKSRRNQDAVEFFKKCRRNAGQPSILVTDGLGAYNAGRRVGLESYLNSTLPRRGFKESSTNN